jgi:hypothetical protein
MLLPLLTNNSSYVKYAMNLEKRAHENSTIAYSCCVCFPGILLNSYVLFIRYRLGDDIAELYLPHLKL